MTKTNFSLPKPILSERIKGRPIGLTKQQKEAINKIQFTDKKLLRRIVRVFNIWNCNNDKLATRLEIDHTSISISVFDTFNLIFHFTEKEMIISSQITCDWYGYDTAWNAFCQYMFRYVRLNDTERKNYGTRL